MEEAKLRSRYGWDPNQVLGIMSTNYPSIILYGDIYLDVVLLLGVMETSVI